MVASSLLAVSLLACGPGPVFPVGEDTGAVGDEGAVFRSDRDASGGFSLARNGATVLCRGAEVPVGSSGQIGDVVYTKRDRAALLRLVEEGQETGDYSALSTACTSDVRDFHDLFNAARGFNEDIGSWDVAKGQDFSGMFSAAASFNRSLAHWNVQSATDMDFMFFEANSFNHDLGFWYPRRILLEPLDFDGPHDAWTRGRPAWGTRPKSSPNFRLAPNGVTVTCDKAAVGEEGWAGGRRFTRRDRDAIDALVARGKETGDYNALETTCTTGLQELFGLFLSARTFNADIGNWDTSAVKVLFGTFLGAVSFNRDIGDWDVSNVETMALLFQWAEGFNQDLSRWDVAKNTDFGSMFFDAFAFNQDLSSWDLRSAGLESDWTDSPAQESRPFLSMFDGARSFNQDLSAWCVEPFGPQPGFDDGATDWTLPRPRWGEPCGG